MKKMISMISAFLVMIAFSSPFTSIAKSAEFFTIGTGGPTGVYFQTGNAARLRPADMQVQSVLDYQRGKIERGLSYLDGLGLSYTKADSPDAADIGLACALDYLDFRQVADWQALAPSLVPWITDFAASVPGYKQTLPEGIAAAAWR